MTESQTTGAKSSARAPITRILLVGNPNVGKSVVFSRLTGVHVISSNYPGTTVGFTQGSTRLGNRIALLIDVPGIYGLSATCKAEEIAIQMLEEADAVINVADATNLERSLPLTLHLREKGVPMVVALNIWDDALHKGIKIDVPRLERELGVPVVPTVAVTGEGIKEMLARLPMRANCRAPVRTDEERWAEVGRIIAAVQTIEHRHHTLLERIDEASVHPSGGLPIAIIVLALSFLIIRGIGEGTVNFLMDPLFNYLWLPVLTWMGSWMDPEGIAHTLLIGGLIDGRPDFLQSFGLLSTGLYVGFAIVMPYVLAFYLVLGIMEDIGYLPRLAVLLDTLMHRLGLHGWSVIPMLLGLGCNVPGILATRVLENRREREIASTLVAIAVPCASLQAMMWGILGPYGVRYVALVYGTLFVIWILIGRLLNRMLKGESPELVLEIPPYRMPPARVIVFKLWMRMRSYLVDAVPFVMLGVLAVSLLQYLHVFQAVTDITAPVFTRILGLPKEAVLAVIVGIFRKDVAVGMLSTLHLQPGQLVVAVTVLATSFPCVATFIVLAKELGWLGLARSTTLMLATALLAGAALNLVL